MASSKNTFTIQVVGLKEFQRDLRAINADFPRELRAANKKAAEVVATEARSRAPKLTGRLAASIKAQASTQSAKVKAGTPSRVPYAAVQEFGWPGHSIAPQPYLYPSIAAKNDDVVKVYYDAVGDLMDRAF